MVDILSQEYATQMSKKEIEEIIETTRRKTAEEIIAEVREEATDAAMLATTEKDIEAIIASLRKSGCDRDFIINILMEAFGVDSIYASMKYDMPNIKITDWLFAFYV